jgi:hemoglobin/transferrin/lactoferrin receptor protein
MPQFHRKPLITSILSVLAAGSAQAEPLANAPGPLEEVVITASRYEQRLLDTPASLSVIDDLDISRSTAYVMADLLRDVPGIQVTDSGQAGLKRVRIRGEESRRSAILINSQEVTDHHEVGTPLTLHPSMIERVEVIRGSGSVLYGSRALSGVVNFITRKGGVEPVQATVSGAYDGATEGYDGFASVYGNIDGFEYRLAYSDGDHDERQTPQGEIENTAFDSNSVYVYMGRNFGDQRLEYTFEDYDSSADIFVEEEVRSTYPLTDFALNTPQRDRMRHSLQYSYEVGGDWLDLVKANAFYQDSDREFDTYTETVWYERDINSVSELITTGGLLQLESMRFEDHHLIAGVQYLKDDIDQDRYVDTLSWSPIATTGQEHIMDEANIETWAVFVQDEWSASDRLTLSAGLRQYWVDGELEDSNRDSLTPGNLDDDDELIGAVGLVYDYSDGIRLRANIAEGYVYPSLMQLATGAYAGSRFVNPTPDLEPETSTNYELGLRVQTDRLVIDAAAFYSESDDYIHHLPCTPEDQCPGRRDRVYQNIGESKAHGVELFAQYAMDTLGLRPYANVTWTKRRNEYAEFSTWDSGIPDISGRAGLRWQGDIGGWRSLWADAYVRGEMASELKEPGSSRTVVEDRSSWTTLNLAGGLAFGEREQYQVSMELYNLTDETYITSAENLYAPERSAAVKFTMDF